MSASQKKKLRNEQNAAAMTEKQQQEIQEAKKLRLYTRLFAIAIAVMLVVVIATSVMESGIIERNTTALTVGETKISAAELNHYYVDSINGYLSEVGDYVSLFGLDLSKPLNEQFVYGDEETTWADYFLEQATTNAHTIYAYYNAAVAEGFTLSDEAKSNLDLTMNNLNMTAALRGYSNVDTYVRAAYGEGCDKNTYRDYVEVQMLASEYATAKNEALTYTDEDLRAEEAENFNLYSAFDYNYYYMNVNKFYEGGTTDEEGVTTYTDEEKAAGVKACEEAAKALAACTTIEELDAAIAALPMNAEVENAKSTAAEGVAYNSVISAAREWITASNRKAGDITYIANESTTTDAEGNETTVVNGYYVVVFNGKDDNLTKLVNVRHILITPEGGTYDSATGTTTYTDEAKAAAKKTADDLLAQFLAGDVTEDAFAALANEHSDDGDGTTGGLYEDVYPGQMVQNFNDWCFDAARKTGDTAVVESEFGYHVMYFSGLSNMTYRDMMIESALRSADMAELEASLLEAHPLNVLNTKNVMSNLIVQPAN